MTKGVYRIDLNDRWSLEEFYQLPHVFSQLYSFHYAFLGEGEVRDWERLEHAFSSYPWHGGYSAVNFYRVLHSQVPPRFRPDVMSVRFASPGWLDVRLLLEAARELGKVVAIVGGAAFAVAKAYNEIHKGLHDRRLLRIEIGRQEIRFAKDKLDFVKESSEILDNLMGLNNLEQLNQLTNNPLASLKIQMSYYRRVKTLVTFVEKGKATFPEDGK
jgi:hypothetical protein